MATLKSIARIVVASSLLIGICSCGNHSYTTAHAYTPGNEVFGFERTAINAVYEPGTAPASITVAIERDKADKAATLVLSSAKGSAAFAPSVSFEKGQKTASLTIDLASLRAGSHICDTIFMAPDFRTREGASYLAIDLSMGYTWTRLSDSGCSYALLTDDLISPYVSGASATFPVIIEEAVEAPGMYRLVNPLGAYSKEDCDIIINATNPAEVIVARQNTGIDLGHGSISIESLGAYHLENGRRPSTIRMAGYFGTLDKGIITFKGTESFYMHAGGERNRANLNGSLRIVLPSMVAQVEKTESKEHYALGVAYYQSPEAISVGSYALADE